MLFGTGVFLVVILLLQLVYSLLMVLYYGGWKQTESFSTNSNKAKTSISIIIVARNEEDTIAQCLKGVCGQNYPNELYEVILVDDNSTDRTVEIARKLGDEKLTVLSNGKLSGKKAGITKAIKQAKGELIITTDADCRVSPYWIKTMADYYDAYQPKLITGLVRVNYTGGLFNAFQTLDMAGMMGVTAGAIANGKPQMCNGANMAYPKAAFEAVKGYEGVEHWPTGDDQLLMFKLMEKFPQSVRFLKSKAAIVSTSPVSTWRTLWHQRLRWVSKSKAMPKLTVSLVLILAYLYNICLLFTLILGVVISPNLLLVGLIMLVNKFIIEWPIVHSLSRFLNQSKGLKWFPVVQVLHLVYVVLIGPTSQFFNYKWKDRLHKQWR